MVNFFSNIFYASVPFSCFFLIWSFLPECYINMNFVICPFLLYHFPVWLCMYSSDDLFLCFFCIHNLCIFSLVANYMVWVNKLTLNYLQKILSCKKSSSTQCELILTQINMIKVNKIQWNSIRDINIKIRENFTMKSSFMENNAKHNKRISYGIYEMFLWHELIVIKWIHRPHFFNDLFKQ